MQIRSVQTRERIAIATARAINDRSYDRASIASIAADAGVTTGAFYFHFRSKEDAALAVMNIQNSYSQARALEQSAGNGPTLQLMLETSSGLMIDIVQDPIIRAGVRLSAEIGLLDTFPTHAWQGWISNNIEQLASAKDEGAIRPGVDLAGAAELLVASIAGVFLLCSLERRLSSLLPRIHLMWQQFIFAYTTDVSRWLALAEELFDVPFPQPLTLAQIQQRHRAGIASEMEGSGGHDEPIVSGRK